MSELPTYVLERTFDAPRDLVWKAWTDPQLLPRWYGPRAETIVHRLDLRDGCPAKLSGRASYDGGGQIDRTGAGPVLATMIRMSRQ